MAELFSLHDLNGNGLLEESELVQLNERIAILHHGAETDTEEVREKYSNLFRDKLDPDGKPVPFETFRAYACEVLNGLDTDFLAQEMILEQFVAEARSGRQAFNLPGLFGEMDPGPPAIDGSAATQVCGWLPDCRLATPLAPCHHSVRTGGWLVQPATAVRSPAVSHIRVASGPRCYSPPHSQASASALHAAPRRPVMQGITVTPHGSYVPPATPNRLQWGLVVARPS